MPDSVAFYGLDTTRAWNIGTGRFVVGPVTIHDAPAWWQSGGFIVGAFVVAFLIALAIERALAVQEYEERE